MTKLLQYNFKHRNTVALSAVVLSLALSGCATHTPFDRTAMALPAAMPTSVLAAPDERTEPWWRTYDDPQMVMLVERALAENLEIEIALARLEQAAGAARLSGAQRLPNIGVDGSAGVNRQSLADPLVENFADIPGFDRTEDIYGLNLAASWEIDLFGRLAAGERAAIADAASAQAQVIGARLTVAAETAITYVTALELQEQIKNSEERIGTLEKLARIVRLRYDRGIAARLEVDQIEADLSSARSVLPMLRSNSTATEIRLQILTGGMPNLDPLVIVPAPIPAAPLIDVSGTPAELLLRRPDLVAAEQRVAAADARVAQAIAAYYPRFSLNGLLGLLSGNLGDLLTGDAFRAEGAIGAAIPLFDFGRRDAQFAVSKAGTREAIESYRLSIRQALGEVESSLTATAREQERATELSNAVSILDRTRSTSWLAYKAGAVSLIEVLDAERRLLEAQSRLTTANAQATRSSIAAYRALGVRSVDAGVVDAGS